MKKYLALVSALWVESLTLAPLTKVYALGEAAKAVEVTPEDAAKKYPPTAGKPYPPGIATATTTGGFIQSAHSNRVYQCPTGKPRAPVMEWRRDEDFVRPRVQD